MAATTQAANLVEKAVGHSDNATVTTDVSNYSKQDFGEETGAKIKATVWNGKNSVKIGANREVYAQIESLTPSVEMPKPRVIDDCDVILKVTGAAICGSDLHLYHGRFDC